MMCYHRTIVKTAAFSSALLIGSTNAASAGSGVPTMEKLHSFTQDLDDDIVGSGKVPDITTLDPQAGYTGNRPCQSGAAPSDASGSDEHVTSEARRQRARKARRQRVKSPFHVYDYLFKYESDEEELNLMQKQLMLWANGFVLHSPENPFLGCCHNLPFMDFWINAKDDVQREVFHLCRVGVIGCDSNLLHKGYEGDYLDEKRSEAQKLFPKCTQSDWDELTPTQRAQLLRGKPDCDEVRIMNGEISYHKEEDFRKAPRLKHKTMKHQNNLFEKWLEQLEFYSKSNFTQGWWIFTGYIEHGHSYYDKASGSNPRNMPKELAKEAKKYILSILKKYERSG